MTVDDVGLKSAVRAAVKAEVDFRHHRVMLTLGPTIVIVAVIATALAGVAFYNSQRVTANQAQIRRDSVTFKNDLALIRTLNSKFCTRVDDTRAVLILRLRAEHAPAVLANEMLLYACPSGFADGKVLLTPQQREAYLTMIAHGRKPGP